MQSTTLLTGLLALLAAPASASQLMALRVDRAETITDGSLEHAVLVIDGGKIQAIGRDLPVERGIPTYDLPEGWVVTPGFVACSSRVGLRAPNIGGASPQTSAIVEVRPGDEIWEELREQGVTTIGVVPPGSAIPGQAVAVRTHGDTLDEMVIADGVFLVMNVRADPSSKKLVRKLFESADEYDEKVAKARAKWEKEQEKKKKKKKSSKSKKKKDDDDDKAVRIAAADDDDDDDGFEPPEAKPEVQPVLELRSGELAALVTVRRSADYLHFLDAIGDEDFLWNLRVPLGTEIDFYEVKHKIAEAGTRVVFNPRLTMRPATRRQINVPREFAEAGVPIAFVPNRDSLSYFEEWRTDVGGMVRAGLDYQVALRAMTLEPAEVLGLGDRFGSLEVGKDANVLIFDGDPLEPATRLRAVLIEGEVVHGELD